MVTAEPILSGIKHILAAQSLDGDGAAWRDCLNQITDSQVETAIADAPGSYRLEKLLALISPAAEKYLEPMAVAAHNLTLQRFGRTIRLYAPLYLSNLCINSCRYCGFNRDNRLPRVRLTIDQALAEAKIIADNGFRDLLLVSSEDTHFVTIDYLAELAGALRKTFASIAVEIFAIDTSDYARLFEAGVDGVTLYQETYDRTAYDYYHPAGPKADYDYRLAAPDRMAKAGMREIGLGILLGLTDWRASTLALAEHANYLIKRYWQSHVSFSFPRIRPAADVNREQYNLVSDKQLVQMMLALRLCFADAGLVISTRESAPLRDRLIKLGVTKMSAGSKTSPGGYTTYDSAVEQFAVNDSRTADQVAAAIRLAGLDAVWKDWDAAFGRLPR